MSQETKNSISKWLRRFGKELHSGNLANQILTGLVLYFIITWAWNWIDTNALVPLANLGSYNTEKIMYLEEMNKELQERLSKYDTYREAEQSKRKSGEVGFTYF